MGKNDPIIEIKEKGNSLIQQSDLVKPPLTVCIVGVMFIFTGASSVSGLVMDILNGKVLLNLGILGLFLGYGILKGSDRARSISLVVSVVTLIIVVAVSGLGIYLMTVSELEISLFDQITIYLFALYGIVLCLFSFWAIKREASANWFKSTNQGIWSLKNWVWAISIVVGFSTLADVFGAWRNQKILNSIYHFKSEIILVDSITNEPLPAETYVWPMEYREGFQFFIKGYEQFSKAKYSSSTFTSDGTVYHYSGLVTQPVRITLRANGYELKSFYVGKEAEEKLRISMIKIPTPPKPFVGPEKPVGKNSK